MHRKEWQRVESRFKSKTEVQSKIDRIEKLTEDEEGQKSITIGGKTLASIREVLQEGTQYEHVQDIICRICVCTCAPRFRENYSSA